MCGLRLNYLWLLLIDLTSIINKMRYNCCMLNGKRTFWAKGYYVSTVGGNKAAIAKYIRDQENEDMVADQMSFKEYENPFKHLEKD